MRLLILDQCAGVGSGEYLTNFLRFIDRSNAGPRGRVKNIVLFLKSDMAASLQRCCQSCDQAGFAPRSAFNICYSPNPTSAAVYRQTIRRLKRPAAADW